MNRRISVKALLTSTSVLAIVATGTAVLPTTAHATSTVNITGIHTSRYTVSPGTYASVTVKPNATLSNTTHVTALYIDSALVKGAVTNQGYIYSGLGPDDAGAIYILDSTLEGGLVNSKDISVNLHFNDVEHYSVFGIAMEGGSITGLTNTGDITVILGESLERYEHAHATGIYIDAATFSGNITNSGDIEVSATASRATIAATADARGIWIAGALPGEIDNYATGVISANADAQALEYADAKATAIRLWSQSNGATVSNSGAISAGATANGIFAAHADAVALQIIGATVFTAVSNSGSISAGAVATSSEGEATAHATGINVVAYHGPLGATFANSGNITATAVTSGFGSYGDAFAGGILVDPTTTGTATVGLTNSVGATIGAMAINTQTYYYVDPDAYATAVGFGVNAGAAALTANITNAGSIGAVAINTLTGGGSDYLHGYAQAVGIGIEGGGGITAGIVNAGTISAYALNTVNFNDDEDYAAHGTATAVGVGIYSYDGPGTASVSLYNSAGATIGAEAINYVLGTIVAWAHGHATAEGVGVTGYSSVGANIVNNGTISAYAYDYISLDSVEAVHGAAYAAGISIVGGDDFRGTLSVNLTNGGSIGATAINQVLVEYADRIHGRATATGVSIYGYGSAVAADVLNTGTVTALAENTVYLFGTAFSSHGSAYAGGFIADAEDGGTALVSLTNTGSIGAVAVNDLYAEYTDVYAHYIRGRATATGVGVFGNTAGASIVNSGAITAGASNYVSMGTVFSSHGSAFAAGINVHAYGDSHASLGLTNGVDGLIGAEALNSANILSGTWLHGKATAIAVDVHGGTSFAGINNAGTIVAYAENVATVGFSEGSHGSAYAAGIDVGGYLVTAPGLVNSAGASIGATAINALVINDVTFYVHGRASATGVYLHGATVLTGITNAGTISAIAQNSVVLNAEDGYILDGHGSAFAAGIDVRGGYVSAPLTNNGLIQAGALNAFTGWSAHRLDGQATAIGVDLRGGTIFAGITNTGTISAMAENTVAIGTAFATHGSAWAAGISIDPQYVSAPVSNGTGAVISAVAINSLGASLGVTWVHGQASAFGVNIHGATVLSGVTNAGTISAFAENSVTLGYSSGVHGSAYAAGIDAGAYLLSAPLVNSIGASIGATAVNALTINDYVFPYGAHGTASATGAYLHGATVLAGVMNAGTISALAENSLVINDDDGYVEYVHGSAFAAGIDVRGGYVSAPLTNNGLIRATAVNAFTGNYSDKIYGQATAYGVEIRGGTIFAGITNTGTISALAENMATVSSAFASHGSAYAAGISIDPYYVSAPVTNGTGAVISAAAYNSLNASGRVTWIHGQASAFGVNVHGATVLSGVTNAGTISAYAENLVTVANTDGVHGLAYAAGIDAGAYLLSAPLINSIGASIGATAINALTILGSGAAYVHGTASASGAYLHGATVLSGVMNAGTISALAENSAVAINDDDSYVEYVHGAAFAAGIDVRGGYVSAPLTNNTLIRATAINAFSGVNAYKIYGQATAIGVDVHGGTIFAGITNTGTISALAENMATVGTAFASHGSAYAAGVSIDPHYVSAPVNNGTGAVISATAYNALNATQVTWVHGKAKADGVDIHGATVYSGVLNSGTISAFAENSATLTYSDGVHGSAHAEGIDIGAYQVTAPVTNNALIAATAINALRAYSVNYIHGKATATGVHIHGATVFTGITNAGKISGIAENSASVVTAFASHGAAYAAGVYVSGYDIASPFNLTNSAGASIGAQAINSLGGTTNNVAANVRYVHGTASAAGVALYASGSAFAAGIVNAGTISAYASNSAVIGTAFASHGYADAVGLEVGADDGDLTVGLTNSAGASIGAVALNSLNGTLSSYVQWAHGTASAAGVGIYGDGSSVTANVTNAGTISAYAENTINIASAEGSHGSASAWGLYADAYDGTLTLSLTNSAGGVIRADAINSMTGVTAEYVHGHATAIAVDAYGDTILGSVANNGTISAYALDQLDVASFYASHGSAYAVGVNVDPEYVSMPVNNGTGGVIAAAAHNAVIATSGSWLHLKATAIGVSVGGRTVFSGITNSGVISATAENLVTIGTITGLHSDAYAAGISVGGGYVSAPLTNNVGGLIQAGAINEVTSTSATWVHGKATAVGVVIRGGTVFAGVSNAGTISALAEGIVSGGAGTYFSDFDRVTDRAQATGVSIHGYSVTGGIDNSGLISAGAWAGGTLSVGPAAYGSFSYQARAIGVNISSGNYTGSIINTGSNDDPLGIYAKAVADPTVTVAGTDVGIFASAEAQGIKVRTGTFTGGVTNYGSIGAIAIATPTVTVSSGAGMSSNSIGAGALARGIDLHAYSISNGILNEGQIQAVAIAKPVVTITGGGSGNVTAQAAAYGVKESAYSLSNGVANWGSVDAVAVAVAAPTYDTTDSSWSANAYAKARGLEIADYSIAGGVLNGTSAVVAAKAVAIAASNGGPGALASASAIGIKVSAYSIAGGIVNNGVIHAEAIAQATSSGNFSMVTKAAASVSHAGFIGGAHPALSAGTSALAQAQGLVVNAATFNGDVTNNGYIGAKAIAPYGFVEATGIVLNVHTAWGSDGGVVTNRGVVWASGKGTTGTVAGIRVATGSVSPGTIINTGLLAGVGQYWPTPDDEIPFKFTVTGIDISGAAAGSGTLIELDPGNVNTYSRVIGDIVLSSTNADTVDINKSYLNGGIYGSGGTAFNSVGQTVNINVAGATAANPWAPPLDTYRNAMNGFYFGFTPWSDGAVGATNYYSDFYEGSPLTDQYGAPNNTWGYYGIEDIQTVNLNNGSTLVMSPLSYMDNIGTLNFSAGSTLVEYVTAPTKNNIHNGVGNNGSAPTIQNVGTLNIGTGVNYIAFETPGWYANTNLYYDNLTYGTANGLGNLTVSSYSPLFTAYLGALKTTDGDATLTLTRVAFGQVAGLDGKEQAFGNFLEQQYQMKGPDLFPIEDLFMLDSSQYHQFMSVVDGEVNMQAWQPLIDVWDNFETMISNRLGGQGQASGGFAGTMPMLSGGGGMGGLSLAAMMNNQMSDAGSPLGSGAQTPAAGGGQGYGFWGRGYGIFANGGNTSTMTGFSENMGGVAAGFDMAATDNLVLGGAFDYAHGSLALNDGSGQGTNNQYQIALYGRYDANPWYVNGVAGVGFGQYSQSRNVNSIFPSIGLNGQEILTPVVGTANANYGETSFAFYGETGYTFKEDQYVLQPLVGLGYIHANFDSFTESGAGMGDLTVGSANANSLISTLGGRAQTTFNLDGGGKIVPSVLVAWQHQFLDTALSLSESLASSPYAGFFGEKGPDYGRDSALLGVGIEGDIWDRTKLFLDYDVRLNGDYTVHAVSGGLRYDF